MIPTWAGLAFVSVVLVASVAGWMTGTMAVPRAVFFGALILPTHRFAGFIDAFMTALEPGGGNGGGGDALR